MILSENRFTLFGIMRALFFFALELLLERGQLGERRIRIRRLVAIARAGTMRLGVILLALGTFHLIAAIAARTAAAALIGTPAWLTRTAPLG